MHRMKKVLVLLCLMLPAYSHAKDYIGAEIRTKESFLYGRFEVSMKSCEASGMLISFFTFYDDPSFVNNWNEIDIEILGRYSNEVQFNAIVGKHQMHEKRQPLDFNPHKEFHVYSFDWTPEYIAWSVDGKEVYRQTGEHIAEMNKPQKIMMNIWPSQFWEWTGPWDESKLPLAAMYDYVKYYEYTPKKADQFTLSWEDSFDRMDYSRWAFASHTFDGNNCDFDPSNASVKNGFLSLHLTKNTFVRDNEEVPEDKSTLPVVAEATLTKKGKVKVLFKYPVNRSAGKKENFKIEGVVAAKASLWMDGLTLELTPGSVLEPGKEYTLDFTAPGQEGEPKVQKIKIK